MKVGEQIKRRMDDLKISVKELAERVGTSGQTVRYWINGRNLPSKRIAKDVEAALSFKIDWTESAGPPPPTGPNVVQAALMASDIQIFLRIQRLPPSLKLHIAGLLEELENLLK
jgi:transcriptional regulator with XRE-family HTH domain